ncbi:MAG: DUF5906 domain-containing protein [Firmicutes bacterium]|nr:DUF5906 domain-containing protein [Bacillota bacterium]
MNFTIYTADCSGNNRNCRYPHKHIVSSTDEMDAVIRLDHVCAEYENNYRSIQNFIESDVVVMDCDNDHSNTPSDWISVNALCDTLDDVAFVIVPSRNNMKDKGTKSARPRFHIYFPIDPVSDASMYADLKSKIHKMFPFFDDKSLDSARFIFGSDADEIVWHEGSILIDDIVQTQGLKITIPEGSRNTTMSRFAGRVIKRYGITDKAYRIFLEESEKCEPPLKMSELNAIWKSAAKFGKRVQAEDGYILPDEYNTEGGAESLKPEDYSDIGQAKVLMREYGDELKYTSATDYLRYNGKCWIESKQQAVGAMEEFLDLQLADSMDEVNRTLKELTESGVSERDVEAGGRRLEKAVGADTMKAYKEYSAALAYKNFVLKRRDMKYVVSALQAAKPMLELSVDELDSNPNLLNTPDATFDLEKGILGAKKHEAADMITKITAVSPSNNGMQIWLDAINLFFCGDKDLINYVQMSVGLAAIGRVYAEAIIIAYGEGSNGKSTFWNTIARVLGTYSGSMSSDTLTVGCKRNVKPEMAELKGKRLVIAAELEEGMRLNTSIVKQLSSTDPITAEKKYKDPFSFTPSHQLVLYTNHLPRITANDEGTWRRLIVIPFNAKIHSNSDKKNYSEYLFEKAGGYVMRWIIEGAEKIIENGYKLRQPECVKRAIADYRTQNDWLGHFLEDCCEVDKSYTEKSGELYQSYRNYCSKNGEYARSTTDFYAALEKLGFMRKRNKNGVIIYGVRIKKIDFPEWT